MIPAQQVLSRRLAHFALDLCPQEQVRKLAMVCLKDSIGCLIAGIGSPAADIAVRYAGRSSSEPQASAAGLPGRIDAALAALINGVTMNAHDFDDICVVMNGHPSAVILPAVMAVGQLRHASGRELLDAYIAGVETAAVFGRAVCPEAFRRGWHCTSVIGILGAVAAAGRLWGLDEAALANALSMAASEASGVKANLGSMTKSFHCGRAAQKALEMIRLTELGCTACPEALESPQGLAVLISGEPDFSALEAALSGAASVFLEPGLGLKPYPSCKCSFNGIDAMLEIMTDAKLPAAEITRITCGMQRIAYENMRFHKPETSLEKKLSMEYCLAAAAVRGNVALGDFLQNTPPEPELQSLMERIELYMEPALETLEEDAAVVTVEFRNGHRVTKTMIHASGSPEKPMRREESERKFRDCCLLSMSADSVQTLSERIDHLPEEADCDALITFVMQCALGKEEK